MHTNAIKLDELGDAAVQVAFVSGSRALKQPLQAQVLLRVILEAGNRGDELALHVHVRPRHLGRVKHAGPAFQPRLPARAVEAVRQPLRRPSAVVTSATLCKHVVLTL
jgi:hypothetical protein